MTIVLYPNVVYENNLAPDHGGSEVDEACEQIYDATKGWGVRTHIFSHICGAVSEGNSFHVCILFS